MAGPPIGPGAVNRRRRRTHRARPMSEINVTPFVDVMLVLLIVFMVSAPLLTAGVPVDLPDAQAKPLAIEKPPITVTETQNGAPGEVTVTEQHSGARFNTEVQEKVGLEVAATPLSGLTRPIGASGCTATVSPGAPSPAVTLPFGKLMVSSRATE